MLKPDRYNLGCTSLRLLREHFLYKRRLKLPVATTDKDMLTRAMSNARVQGASTEENRAFETIRRWLGLELQPLHGNASIVGSA
jgi:hypothetical protein